MKTQIVQLIYSDGRIETYADKETVNVRTINVPDHGDEIGREAFIESMLTPAQREVFWPVNVNRASVQNLTEDETERRMAAIGILEAANGNIPQPRQLLTAVMSS